MSESLRGMYDDFVGYRAPTDDEVADALRTATIVIDTNVLFSLYRRSGSYRRDLLAVLGRFGERLFVPHQVLREYWRNRLHVIADRRKGHDEVVKLIEQHLDSASRAVRQWAQVAAVVPAETDGLTERIRGLKEELVAAVSAYEPDKVGMVGGSATDPVLRELETLSNGSVGAAMSDVEWRAAVQRGAERVEQQIPPGYRDAEKSDSARPEGASGDYLVWSQAMAEVTSRGTDLVLVTDDQKEDWWLRHRSVFVGPRPELVAELRSVCGAGLILLRTSELLERAESAVDVPVSSESVIEARRYERSSWTAEGVAELLALLDEGSLPQADVIRRAAELGGTIDRADVYEVCGFDSNRLLTGFTKPVARLTWELQYSGVVSEGVPPALAPVYDGPGRAQAFEVPDEIVDLLTTPGVDVDT